MENAKKSCGMRQKSRRPLIRINPGVTVDEEDYTTFRKIRSALLRQLKEPICPFAFDLDEEPIWPFSFDLDEEKRISSLTIPRLDPTPPFPEDVIEDVMSLSALKHLHASEASLQSIPPSIGRLKNLESLDLSYNALRSLPAEIGSLIHLKKLILNATRIESLPDTFTSLQKLEVLGLHHTDIVAFPRQILDLASLRELDMSGPLLHVPSSIDRLQQNLQKLSLGLVRNLPKTVGNLTNLKELKLELFASELETSISSLKNLQQLSVLHLQVFRQSQVRQLEFLRELPSLTTLLCRVPYNENLDFLDLVRACPRLGHVGLCKEKRIVGLVHALACNRYNHKFQGNNPFANESNRISKTLWPQILSNATSAFRRWDERKYANKVKQLNIEPHDAVHKLLVDGRESFLQVLLQR